MLLLDSVSVNEVIVNSSVFSNSIGWCLIWLDNGLNNNWFRFSISR